MKKIILLGLATSLSFSGLFAQSEKSLLKEVELAREVISKYVDTRQEIAKVENEWKSYQKLTQDRIDLYTSEIERLQKQISSTEENTTQAEREIAKIRDDISALRASTKVIEDALPSLEDKLRSLYAYFPSPLKNKVKDLVKRLGKKGSRTADRMAILIGVMNEVDKFNSEYILDEDEKVIDGKTKLVDVIYVGLSIAYYADKEGKYAGIGYPAEGEWKWEDDNSIAPAVNEAVQYFNGDIKPALMVNLPVKVTTIDTAN